MESLNLEISIKVNGREIEDELLKSVMKGINITINNFQKTKPLSKNQKAEERRGPKSKKVYRIYLNKVFKIELTGSTNACEFINNNLGIDLKKQSIPRLVKNYTTNNLDFKARCFQKYNGLEIELLN